LIVVALTLRFFISYSGSDEFIRRSDSRGL